MARKGKSAPTNDAQIWLAVAAMVTLNVCLLFMTGFLDMSFSPRGALEKLFGIDAGIKADFGRALSNATSPVKQLPSAARALTSAASEATAPSQVVAAPVTVATTAAPEPVGPGGPAIVLKRSSGTRPMPLLGFGTCCRRAAKGPELIKSTLSYIKLGGRLIDTAFMYGNHRDIAQAVKQSGVKQEELWITDKINPPWMGYDKSVKAIDLSLKELEIRVLDMMLIHLPFGDALKNKPEEAKTARIGTWKAMVEAQKAGKIRHIGVSNFNKEQILELVDASGAWPANNQIEYGPWSPPEAKELVQWMQEKGISVTGYGSLGHAGFDKSQLNSGALGTVSKKYGKSVSQVLLRWNLDNNIATVPGATSEAHIKENLDIADFKLAREDIALIENGPKPNQWKWFHALPGK